jgi:aryl-alcohol dehydrogenase-like predicted oxidoreductase
VEYRRFGRTNFSSSVLVYGAAGLGSVDRSTAADSLSYAMSVGINHYDTAASYGHAEEMMGPDMPGMTSQGIFLATKTGLRTNADAWGEINRSLELLQVDHVDLLQVHAVCDFDDLNTLVFAPDGPLAAFQRAKDEGLTRFVGITGHTEAAPAVHAEALRRFDFDSVLCPMNYQLYGDPQFKDGWEELSELVAERDVALRTIKAIARRPYLPDEQRYATWYKPFEEQAHITAAVSWVLGSFPQIAGIATAGETTLLSRMVEAEANRIPVDEAAAVLAEVDSYSTIFV